MNKEGINAVYTYFEGLDQSLYKNGITALEHRYERYIKLDGDWARNFSLHPRTTEVTGIYILLEMKDFLFIPIYIIIPFFNDRLYLEINSFVHH